MKSNAIVRIVLYSIVILVLVGLLLVSLGISTFSFRDSNNPSGEFIPGSAGSVDPDVIRSLEIEWAAGSITIQRGDSHDISFYETGVTNTKYQMVWKQNGDKLVIEYCADSEKNLFGGISINIGSEMRKDLVITVPYGWDCASLNVVAASAEVNVNELVIGEAEFDGASGICTFTNCQVDKLEVETASGDIKFAGSLSELDFEGMSSSFTAVLSNTPSRMRMDSMSGNLDITLPSSAGFTASIDAMSSDFSSDFSTTKQNGNYICGDGSCKINVSAMSGDVTIRMGE